MTPFLCSVGLIREGVKKREGVEKEREKREEIESKRDVRFCKQA
jgi:hypothetical protein